MSSTKYAVDQSAVDEVSIDKMSVDKVFSMKYLSTKHTIDKWYAIVYVDIESYFSYIKHVCNLFFFLIFT